MKKLDYHIVYLTTVLEIQLSVGLSACPVCDPKSRTKRHRKLKIDRKEAPGTSDS